MGTRFFTLEQARQLLPQVRELASQASTLAAELPGFAEHLKELAAKSQSNSGSPEGTRFLHRLVRLQSCLLQLEELGVQVKGVQEGLIDFPAQHEGREICLCWKVGEDDIEFWHEVDAGFAGRMPVSELLT